MKQSESVKSKQEFKPKIRDNLVVALQAEVALVWMNTGFQSFKIKKEAEDANLSKIYNIITAYHNFKNAGAHERAENHLNFEGICSKEVLPFISTELWNDILMNLKPATSAWVKQIMINIRKSSSSYLA